MDTMMTQAATPDGGALATSAALDLTVVTAVVPCARCGTPSQVQHFAWATPADLPPMYCFPCGLSFLPG